MAVLDWPDHGSLTDLTIGVLNKLAELHADHGRKRSTRHWVAIAPKSKDHAYCRNGGAGQGGMLVRGLVERQDFLQNVSR